MTAEQKAALKSYIKNRKAAAVALAEAEVLKLTVLEILKDAGAPIVHDGAIVELAKDAEYEYPGYIKRVCELANDLREDSRKLGTASKTETTTVKFTLSKAKAL
jgi:hypothetical protein